MTKKPYLPISHALLNVNGDEVTFPLILDIGALLTHLRRGTY